jgi:PASTA domain-containing protein
MRRRALGIALVALGSLIPAGAAAANTLTLGSQFQGTIKAVGLDGGAGTVANTSLPAPLLSASPTDGTVISWRFSADNDPFTPQIIRPVGGNLYTEAGNGPVQNGTSIGNIVGPFPLSLPIQKGDLFGFSGKSFSSFGYVDRPSATAGYWVPPLAPGPGRASGPAAQNIEEAISATVRYCLVPNLKGKKPKQAKQALKAADCTVGTKRKSKKRRKKKKVVSQSVVAGTSISDTAPINFKVSRPKG